MTLSEEFSPLSSSTIGIAAECWMALMDRLLILRNDVRKEKEVQQVTKNILKLIDLYYEALDAPKKGGGKVGSILHYIIITFTITMITFVYFE
jgi:RNA-dependent RNA polymerase